MMTDMELAEYLQEIREQVCSRCVERPPGGPPCTPLGKNCGVELHLPELIDSIHAVQSDSVEPYLDHNRQVICSTCAFLHSSICPCPMEYLLVLITQAIETVDERFQRRERIYQAVTELEDMEEVSIEDIRQAYQEATGTWTGCDWHTTFGKTGLDLKGWTATRAEIRADQVTNPVERKDWQAAVQWLTRVEEYAKQAEAAAAEAVVAAVADQWEEANKHMYRAWATEFSTGRPIWRGFPLAWQRLRQLIDAAARSQKKLVGKE
ncbi:MAG: hypothetical protein ACK4RK_17290 [Gemmataceae bacterium]